ncbi:MAG: dTDP-4-dehydrorhamnose reductase [Candidatus Bathyarchaeia archaeon]
MKILVTGASGLLGSKVVEIALKKGNDVYSGYLTHNPSIGNSIRLDISNRETVLRVVKEKKPDAIIHCAALTDVDKCEINKELAMKINVDGARFMAEAAKKINAYLTFISTDYVFDGLKGFYKEDDEPCPMNFYGCSKLLGEKAVEEIAKEYLIARASVIYGAKPASGKTNFALWLINALRGGQEVKVLTDQYVSPTLNTNLAEMLLEACERRLTGIYHLAGADRVSRYEFAIKFAETLGMNKGLIKKAEMSEISWVAKRPKDSSLNVSKAEKAFKIKPMKLHEALKELKRELKCLKA